MKEEKHGFGRGRAGRHHVGAEAQPTDVQAIRLILTPVDESREARARLDVAAHLARALDAALLGVGVEPSHARTVQIERTRPQGAEDEPGGPHRLFIAKMTNAAVAHSWCEVHVENRDEIESWAKSADLIVVSRLTDATPRWLRADHLGLECGRPILVLPPQPPTDTLGLNVMMAWDGSREAIRALHDAMPLMRDAAYIHIVECKTDMARTSHHPDAQVARGILERHGFQAFSEVEVLESQSVADKLLECVHRRGANLLITGLYHHSRLREYVLGGVSRELLDRCPIALLVSH